MRFYRTRRYNFKVMRIAKYSLVATVSVALIVGLVYSQLCSTICSFYGCSPFETSEVTECSQHNSARQNGREQSGHHGQNLNVPAPQESSRSHDCAVHTDLTATFSAAKNTIAPLRQHEPPSVVAVLPILNLSPVNLIGNTHARAPDRSPPQSVSISILRI